MGTLEVQRVVCCRGINRRDVDRHRLDSRPVAPPKHKTGGGRTTPKRTRSDGQKYANPDENKSGVHATSRYTPPVPIEMKIGKPWVPFLMVGLLLTGMVVIVLRNLVFSGNNTLTLVGLSCILGGLFTATKWR